jgi:hypothetical protein
LRVDRRERRLFFRELRVEVYEVRAVRYYALREKLSRCAYWKHQSGYPEWRSRSHKSACYHSDPKESCTDSTYDLGEVDGRDLLVVHIIKVDVPKEWVLLDVLCIGFTRTQSSNRISVQELQSS